MRINCEVRNNDDIYVHAIDTDIERTEVKSETDEPQGNLLEAVQVLLAKIKEELSIAGMKIPEEIEGKAYCLLCVALLNGAAEVKIPAVFVPTAAATANEGPQAPRATETAKDPEAKTDA